MVPQLLERIGMRHIDAELLILIDSAMIGKSMIGYIYNDKAARFQDGTLVTTSKVNSIEITKEGTFVTTMNTVYKLV